MFSVFEYSCEKYHLWFSLKTIGFENEKYVLLVFA